MRYGWLIPAVLIVAAPWAPAVQLVYRLAPGELLDYTVKLSGQGTVAITGRSSPVTMTGELRFRQAVRSVDSVGRMTITTTVPYSKIAAQWGGQPLPVNLNFPPITVIMSPNGQMSGAQVARASTTGSSALLGQLNDLLGGTGGGLDASTLGNLGSLTNQVMLFDPSEFFSTVQNLGLPTGPVQLGQTWTDITTLMSPSGQQLAIQSSTRLAALETIGGHPCARLLTSYSVPLDLNLQTAQSLGISGSHQGTNTTLFAVDLGRPVRTDSTASSRMTMAMPDLNTGQTSQATMTMTVKSTTTLAGW